jgi:hypothetical protein
MRYTRFELTFLIGFLATFTCAAVTAFAIGMHALGGF